MNIPDSIAYILSQKRNLFIQVRSFSSVERLKSLTLNLNSTLMAADEINFMEKK